MKLRSRFAPPPVDRSSVLPLLLVVLLVAALAIQMLVSSEFELPPSGPVRGGAAAAFRADAPPPATGGARILGRSMFAPAVAPAKASEVGQGLLGPYVIVGSVQVGRATFALVQTQVPPARIFRARPGARIGEWLLRTVTRDEARLSRGGERLRISFGPNGPVAAQEPQGRGE